MCAWLASYFRDVGMAVIMLQTSLLNSLSYPLPSSLAQRLMQTSSKAQACRHATHNIVCMSCWMAHLPSYGSHAFSPAAVHQRIHVLNDSMVADQAVG